MKGNTIIFYYVKKRCTLWKHAINNALSITTVKEQDSNLNYHSWPSWKKRKPTCNWLWITIRISCGYQIKRLVSKMVPLMKYLCLQFILVTEIFVGGRTQLTARLPGLVV